MDHRTLLLGTAGAVATAIASGSGLLVYQFVSAKQRLAKRQKLMLPPVIDGRGGAPVRLTAAPGSLDFGTGAASDTLGYNGPYLGPVIRIANGRDVPVAVENHLKELTTLHWHGLAIDGPLDGGPHQPIEPGATWSTHLFTKQSPTLAWYHSHVHGKTAAQVHAGLAGTVLIEDGSDRDFGLPNRYGDDEFLLVAQDKRFDAFGRMRYAPDASDALLGYRGDTITINGVIDPYLDVPSGLVRLRLLNASNARFFNFHFDDGRPLYLVGTDAGSLESPLPLKSLRMAPAERCDVLVEFSNGSPATLWSRPDSNGGMSQGSLRAIKNALNTGFLRSFPVIEFRPTGALKSDFSRVPPKLNAAPAAKERPIAKTRAFTLDMTAGKSDMPGMDMGIRFTISGQIFDMAKINQQVALNSTERWTVSTQMMAHPFHVHGCRFKVRSEDGKPPRPENIGWKDVVVIEKEVEVDVEFDNSARSDAPFMYHCHILEHEDAGMMGQLSVT